MIERVLFDVLSAGSAAILATPTLLDAIFQPEGSTLRISAAELAKIKATFAAYPPKIRHGYPFAGTHLPCWSIILASEDQEKQLLGNYATDDDTPGTNIEVIGSIERRVYALVSYGVTPDAVIWYHKILKAIILANLVTFQRKLIDVAGYSGQELMPMPMDPEIAFGRELRLTVRVEEYVSLAASSLVPPEPRYTGVDVRRVDVGGGVDPEGM